MKVECLPGSITGSHGKRAIRKPAQWSRFPVYGVAALAVCFLVLPMLGLLACTSLYGSRAMLTSPTTSNALLLSFATSTLSTAIVVVFGGALAYVLARTSFKGAILVDTLVDVPMVLPPMVTGLALLMFLGPNGPLGSLLSSYGISLVFTAGAVVVAQVFVSLPFFVRAAKAAFESIDPKLERASLLLGASRCRTFFEVTIPTVWPPLAAGAVLAWARSLGEFGATLVFAGNFQGSTQTMPLAIFGALQDNLDVAVALSMLLLITSFLLVVFLKMLTSRYGKVQGAAG